jgi:hypothetical protein
MGKIGERLRTLEGGRVAFMCPGCNEYHHVTVDGSRGWTWNNNADLPTFSPSVLVKGVAELTDEEYNSLRAGLVIEPKPTVCHSFVKGGYIQFLDDCTHTLKGQTVLLPVLSD